MKTSRRNFLINASRAGVGVFAYTHLPGASILKAFGEKTTAKVVWDKGVGKIKINDQLFEPLSFRSFRPEQRNITDFHKAGIRLMSILHTGLDCTLDVPYSPFGESWIGPRQYDFTAIDRQMDLFIKNAPGTYFNIMLQLDTRDWYVKANDCNSNSYWNLVEMAGHQPWREDTASFLQDMLRYFEEKYGDRIFAYSLLCGASTEWYTNSQGNGRPEALLRYHPLKEAAFRKFKADPSVKLLPLDILHKTSNGVFRDPTLDDAALRYWHFHHEIIGDAILYFSKKAQEVLQHNKLLGLYYGYLTQLDNKRLLEEGHLAYEKVWASRDLDMIFAPAKYGRPRSFEGTSGFLLTLDSLQLHNKILFQEIDHTTYIAPQTVENGRRIPGSDSKLKDEFQTRMVLRREFVLTRVKRASLWWFDFFGGYYYAEPLMKEITNMVRMQEQHLKNLSLKSVAEIAVFGDVASMYYTQAFSSLASDLLVTMPDELARIGAPYDIFNFSDLNHDKLNIDQYKLVIFLNAFKIPEDKLSFIQNKIKSGGRTVLWFYSPNYIQDKAFSEDAIATVTDLKIKLRKSEDHLVQVRGFGKLPPDTTYSFSKPRAIPTAGYTTVQPVSAHKITPLFEIEDRNAEVLGIYESDGKAALAKKQMNGYTSMYSAVGNMTAPVFREIARQAGVHIYYEGSDPVYINNRLIGVHFQNNQDVEIKLPFKKTCQLKELFDGGDAVAKGGKVVLPLDRGATKLYLLQGGENVINNKKA